jgi:xylulokinase
MLQFLGIDASQLPEVTPSGQVAGRVTAEAASRTGLAPGTPVTTAPMDQICAAVGAGNIAPGMITENTGAALAICATVEAPSYDPQRRVGCYIHAVKGRYVLLPWVQTAGMALRWFRDELGGGLDYDRLCREAAAVPPGAEGLVFLPYLAGAGCPDMDSRARGVFWRIGLGHRRAHFARAVLESVAFLLRRNMEFLSSLGFRADEVRCLGGGSRSELWVRIKADMLNLPCVIMDTEESTALGVAVLAAVGAGLYPTPAEAVKKMVRVSRRIKPDPARAEAYQRVYQRYARLHGQLVGLFASDSP